MEEEGVGPDRTILLGFSQGTMLSLHVAPRRAAPLAGIVAFSLSQAGFDVYAHVMKGTGHGIAPDGLSVALAFMRDRLGM